MEGTATTQEPEQSGEPQRAPERRPRSKREIEQARRRRNRLLPLLALAAVSFGAGAVLAAGSPEKEAVDRFIKAWTKQDFAGMHTELTDEAAAAYPLNDFGNAYLAAQNTATATAIDPGDASGPDGSEVAIPVGVRTEIFGLVEREMRFPVSDGAIAWEPHLTFPGLEQGQRLGRRLELSDRAAILAANGTPLAEGEGADRASPLGSDAIDVVGEVGRPDDAQSVELRAEGYPSDAEVGISGLERAFNSELAGVPGGELLAVTGEGGDVAAGVEGNVLATAEAKAGEPVKTTIDPGLQEAAVTALGGRFGGVAVLDARDGSILGLAGSAYSQLAPRARRSRS